MSYVAENAFKNGLNQAEQRNALIAKTQSVSRICTKWFDVRLDHFISNAKNLFVPTHFNTSRH